MVTRRGMLTVMGSIVTVSLAGAAIETRIARSVAERDQQLPAPAVDNGIVVAPVNALLQRAQQPASRDSRHTGR